MNNSILIAYLISDFNVQALARALESNSAELPLAPTTGPFGQVFPALLQEGGAPANAVRVVWTSPEGTIPEFGVALEMKNADEARCLRQVDEFAAAVAKNASQFKATLVASWTLPLFHRGYGMLDFRPSGLRRLLLKMNLRLAEQLDSVSSTYMLDSQRWIEAVGKSAWNRKLWYLNKTPFVTEVFSQAAQDIKGTVSALTGASRKIVMVDLDGTLWDGAIGDLGWEQITLGGHHHHGEAFVDFQKALKSLTRRGILLGIASKNDEQLVLEAFAKHPEMILRLDDFAGWRINWNDKAENIVDLASALNLGLHSVVFIDDNPVERARVREALPEVFVPDWPGDKTLFASELLRLRCFDVPHITKEDLGRTHLYAAQRARQSSSTCTSLDQWLQSLDTVLTAEDFNQANRPRCTQLLNKTNQMNLHTRRMTEAELSEWLNGNGRKLWTFRVKDRFGDSGLVGIVSIEVQQNRAEIIDFVLSCRAMGRKIEHAMVAAVAQYCREHGILSLRAQFVPTRRNKPCLDFWLRSGFKCESESAFTWQLSEPYTFPSGIDVVMSGQVLSNPGSTMTPRVAALFSDEASQPASLGQS